MDQRHLIAYAVLLLTLAGLAVAWLHATRDRRAARRASNRHKRERRERRDADRTAGES